MDSIPESSTATTPPPLKANDTATDISTEASFLAQALASFAVKLEKGDSQISKKVTLDLTMALKRVATATGAGDAISLIITHQGQPDPTDINRKSLLTNYVADNDIIHKRILSNSDEIVSTYKEILRQRAETLKLLQTLE